MKRIAIFIDGTWNRPDARHPTNVVRLAQCVRPYNEGGMPQVVSYSTGVGAGQGTHGWREKPTVCSGARLAGV
jgi:uncharacterized protein (DUF2235 family)